MFAVNANGEPNARKFPACRLEIRCNRSEARHPGQRHFRRTIYLFVPTCDPCTLLRIEHRRAPFYARTPDQRSAEHVSNGKHIAADVGGRQRRKESSQSSQTMIQRCGDKVSRKAGQQTRDKSFLNARSNGILLCFLLLVANSSFRLAQSKRNRFRALGRTNRMNADKKTSETFCHEERK